MTEHTSKSAAKLLKATDGPILDGVGGVRNRFLIDGSETDHRFAVVQHLIAPHSLAAPMHRHHDEDEYTFVLGGRIGAVSNGIELFAEAGDLLFKPRGEWHTFFNADDEPASMLELISPGGIETLFRSFGSLEEPLTPEGLAERAAPYHCDADFEATMPLLGRYGLSF
jgi:mannose-6-phosphate isomerase-like protein (cupin superfamily)